MTVMMRYRYCLVFCLLLFLCRSVAAQNPHLDWKLHDIGKMRQVVTNMGALWRCQTRYPGLLYCEFPPGSNEEHVGEGGPWIGAIVGTPPDTFVSVTTSWSSADEFFPTDAEWDTIWVVCPGDTVDIPYWPNYTPVSQQDFVCRYQDDFWLQVLGHNPLHVEIIERSFAWGYEPLDEFIIFEYRFINKQDTLRDAYLAFWLDANIGNRLPGWAFAQDDFSWFDEEHLMGISEDGPRGVDGKAFSPLAARVFPPDNGGDLKVTFQWFGGPDVPSPYDGIRYQEMSSGIIMPPQRVANGAAFVISFGPYQMFPGDTLLMTVGLICGEGLDGLWENVERVEWLYNNHYAVPSAPPSPPLKVYPGNHQVRLVWKADPGEINPELYQDPHRADGVVYPFEGYRVYKSTQGIGGPWTLLAEFDKPDNPFGYNTGLQHEYTDVGLLNNIEYYYSVTAYSMPDTVTNFPSLESSITQNAVAVTPGPAPPATVGNVAVVPNPYLGDVDYTEYNPPWEKPPPGRRWMEQDRRIQFINLPPRCTIKIYTLAGDLVDTIEHNDPTKGYEDWNLVSRVGQAIASEIYLFTVEDHNTGKVQVGKFVVIK